MQYLMFKDACGSAEVICYHLICSTGSGQRTLAWKLLCRTLCKKTIYIYSIEGVKALVAQSCLTLWPRGSQSTRFLCPWNSPGKNTGVSCLSLLQGNLPDPGLLHHRHILYMSHQGSPFTELLCICPTIISQVPRIPSRLLQQWEGGLRLPLCGCVGDEVCVLVRRELPHKCAWPGENLIFIKPKSGNNNWQFKRSPHLSHVK